jgi:hypothetical protein
MSDKICFSNIPFFIIVFLLIIILGFIYHNIYSQLLLIKQNQIVKKQESIQNNQEATQNNQEASTQNKREILEYRDSQVKYNDFKPPERRMPEHEYPDNRLKQIINIHTRGEPDNYQLMGVLLRDNTESAFNLFGRQKYPGSNQYEYYAQGKMQYNDVKLPINNNGKELYDNDKVRILGTDESKGDFTVNLYKYDEPRYNPFLI